MYPFVPGSDNGQTEVNREAYQENVSALVHESIDKLSRLGIEGADTSLEWQIRDSYQEYPGELKMDLELYEVNGQVLSFIGMGNYDYDTYEWSPTSSQVYSFDVEVFDVSLMYTLFLQGVSSIAGAAYQQCILFYNTPQWAEDFKELMGYGLE